MSKSATSHVPWIVSGASVGDCIVAPKGQEITAILNGSDAFGKHLSAKITRLPASGTLRRKIAGGESANYQRVAVGDIFSLELGIFYNAPPEQSGSPYASFDYQVVERDDHTRASSNT